MGSSPHARGLRAFFRGAVVGGGIIPARAGFTGHHRLIRQKRPDHPRTRGVYSLLGPLLSCPFGSSPHARGLHRNASPSRAAIGIIPARAGFTSGPRGPGPAGRDHPRTRGVYRVAALAGFRGLGSSPHARGLQMSNRSGVVKGGIIPARAGFTSSCIPPWRLGGDHPRTRGVYL